MRPQPPAELAVRHPARAFTRGHPRRSPGAPVPSARRPSALVRPAVSSERASAWGARVRGRLLAHPVRVLDRRAGVSADLRSSARAERRWRTCRRLRSLLAANQWIAETSAVVEPILRGPSPHSLPIEFPLVPRQGRGHFRREARKRGVDGNSVGTDRGVRRQERGVRGRRGFETPPRLSPRLSPGLSYGVGGHGSGRFSGPTRGSRMGP